VRNIHAEEEKTPSKIFAAARSPVSFASGFRDYRHSLYRYENYGSPLYENAKECPNA